MRTLLDLRGSIPANIHITHGRWHDSNNSLILAKTELMVGYLENPVDNSLSANAKSSITLAKLHKKVGINQRK